MSKLKLSLPNKRAGSILESEERLMRQASGELQKDLIEPEAPTAEAVLSPPPEAKDEDQVPGLIETVPYALVRGEPGVAFVQGRGYYNREKRFVRFAPEVAWYFPAPRPTPTKEQIRAAAAQEVVRLGSVPRVPSKVIEAEKENAQARAAEAHAE